MYRAATHTKTFRPVNMVSPIFSHYLTLRSPRQTTSPAASTSYGQQGRQTGQNCLLGCGSWARNEGCGRFRRKVTSYSPFGYLFEVAVPGFAPIEAELLDRPAGQQVPGAFDITGG